MLNKFIRLIKKEQFQPRFIALFTNPFFFARRGLYKGILEYGPFITGKTLDIGCGQRPYEHLVASTQYIGLEIDTPVARAIGKADVYYSGERFPFEDASFDSVMLNQVFEHVFNPSTFLLEVNRILKPGGRMLLTVPFVWDEHEQPYDYARYSSFGLSSILSKTGFRIVRHKKSVNDLGLIFQLLNAYTYKNIVTKNLVVNQILYLFLMAPVNIIGFLVSKLSPKNNDLYLDNIILAEKVRNV